MPTIANNYFIVGIDNDAVYSNRIATVSIKDMEMLEQPQVEEYSQSVAVRYEELEVRRFAILDKARLLVYDKLVESMRKNGYPDGTYIIDLAATKDDAMMAVKITASTKVDKSLQWSGGTQVEAMPLARDTSYKPPDKIEGEIRIRRNIIITGER